MSEIDVGGLKVRGKKRGKLLVSLGSGKKTLTVKNRKLRRILQTVDWLKQHGYDILQVDRSILVQIHMQLHSVSHQTAYEEVNFLLQLTYKTRLS